MMENTILISMLGSTTLGATIAKKLNLEIGIVEYRDFPDGESYVRVVSAVQSKKIIIVCTLDHPNHKILPLLFLAETLRQLGAQQIHLMAPYLPYMRQDKSFKPGEAMSAGIFARLLSGYIDSLITVDPHLHRIHQLTELYKLQQVVSLHAHIKIAAWIKKTVKAPLLIGPDEESQQWVSEAASEIDAPYAIIQKTRRGDREVSIVLPPINDRCRTPVLVDDIISTGASMLAAIQRLVKKGFKNPVCVAVHALFNQECYAALLAAGAAQVVTCNTIAHFSNEIDVTDILVAALKKME